MTKTLGTKVENDIYEVFRLACEREGVTVSDRLRDMVNEVVKEEAPFLLIDPQVCLELKRIADREGLDWRKMTCDAIMKFCKKCSQEEEAKTEKEKGEEVKEASTEEKKPEKRSLIQIMDEVAGEILEEEEKKPKEEGSIKEKLETRVKIVRE